MAKDKAIKRFLVRNIVDASAIRDLQDSSVIEGGPDPVRRRAAPTAKNSMAKSFRLAQSSSAAQ